MKIHIGIAIISTLLILGCSSEESSVSVSGTQKTSAPLAPQDKLDSISVAYGNILGQKLTNNARQYNLSIEAMIQGINLRPIPPTDQRLLKVKAFMKQGDSSGLSMLDVAEVMANMNFYENLKHLETQRVYLNVPLVRLGCLQIMENRTPLFDPMTAQKFIQRNL